MTEHALLIAVARALATGEQTLEQLTDRAIAVLGKPRERVAPLAERYVETFFGHARPRHRDVVHFLLNDPAWTRRKRRPNGEAARSVVRHWHLDTDVMQPVAAARHWRVPPITTDTALAEWLGVNVEALAWFADLKGLLRRDARARLHHYHYRLVEKRSGGVRLIEAPQARLKAMQRRILTGMLDGVPPYYTAAYGFVKGRSVRAFAARHVGQRVVLRMDLDNFFPRIGIARVQALFRTMGYPERVADLLGGLCTNAAPPAVFATADNAPMAESTLQAARTLYARPHLPQGAPTSPALANLCAYRLDCRLTALADWAGVAYARYADDMAFSGGGDFARHVERYATEIATIVESEGWRVQHRKTRIMRQSVRQELVGLVVNQRVNVSRTDFDALKATLTNCVRHGVALENRAGHPNFRAYLAGRVGWVKSVNMRKGIRLQEIFDRIDWSLSTA